VPEICLEFLPYKPAQNDVPANDSSKSHKDKQGDADYQKQITNLIFLPGKVLQFESEHRKFRNQ